MFFGCLANQLVIISVVACKQVRKHNLHIHIYIICAYININTLYYIPHIYRTMRVIDICTRSQKGLQQAFDDSISFIYFAVINVYPQLFSRFSHFEVVRLTSFAHQEFNVFAERDTWPLFLLWLKVFDSSKG